MALEYPSNPTTGQVFNNYVWNGTAWAGIGSANNLGVQVATLQTNAALDYHPNYVINGGFDIWQRGTSFNAAASNTYIADRWLISYSGSGSSRNITQQTFTPGTDVGRETQYYININQTSAGTGGTWNEFATLIEDVRTLAGKTVTFSFYAKSSASSIITNAFLGQTFGGSGRVDTSFIPGGIQLTTSWKRYSYTATLPSTAGKTINSGSYLFLAFALPLNSTFNIDIANVQLEEGAVATPFRRAGGTVQGELAACQRYYVRLNQNGYESTFGSGIQTSTTAANCFVPLPVPLRATPSSIGFSQVYIGDRSTVANLATPVNFQDGILTGLTLAVNYSAFGAQFRPCTIQGKGTTPYNSYLEVSAEL